MVLYVWRHDDHPEGQDEWEEEWTYHQLVAISQARALPIQQPEPHGDDDSEDEDEDEDSSSSADDHDPYYSSMANEYRLAAGQVWHSKPWADLFRRFVSRGCSSQVRRLLVATHPRTPSNCARTHVHDTHVHRPLATHLLARWRRWCVSCCWPPMVGAPW
jgi:hypothetical protein